MPTAVKEEVLRFVVQPEMKRRFKEKCARRGQKMSERMRYLIAQDIAAELSPSDRLSGILASASAKNAASGLPEPSIEDIDAFIDSVRRERIELGMVS